MAHGPATERRKYHRIATDQVVSFAELDRPAALGISRDLSHGGIRFEAIGVEINFGDVLRVTFNVGDETIVADGTVVWAIDLDPITQEIGIEFHEIDPRHKALMDEAIGPNLEPVDAS